MSIAPEDTRIEVLTSDLLRMFADVMPFASTDDTLPMINCVLFEFADNTLRAVATDRYTIGVSAVNVGREVIASPRAIQLHDVAKIEKSFKAARYSDPRLALTFGEQGLGVETTDTLDGMPTIHMSFRWVETSFPKWQSVVAGVKETVGQVGVAAMNPAFLAKFAKVQRDGENMVLWPTAPNKPWLITVGDHFHGLIMPVRMHDSAAASWELAEVNVAPEPKKRAPRVKKAAA